MKDRCRAIACIVFAALAFLIFVLNMEVTYTRGVDFRVRRVKVPLYLKIADFISRDLNYRVLAKSIAGNKDEAEKALSILDWTYSKIKRQPGELPVIDDHVWHIIVRGYGMSDQFCDVFATLCNYSGLKAFFSFDKSRAAGFPLAFVRIKGEWRVFDPYEGVFFIKPGDKGRLCTLGDIKKGEWEAVPLVKKGALEHNYGLYFENMSYNIVDGGLKRSEIQSPVNRIIYEVKKWKRKLLK